MPKTLLDAYPQFKDHPLTEKVKESIPDRMELYTKSPVLLDLIRRVADERGISIPTTPEDETYDEETFFTTAQKVLDFRNGGSRENISFTELSSEAKDVLHELIDIFGMRRETEPSSPDFDVAFVPGAAGKIPANRLAYLRELESNGKLHTSNIVLIGSERPVDLKANASGLTEIDRAGNAGYNSRGEQAQTEFDIMRNTASVAYGINEDDWDIIEGIDVEVPHDKGFHDAYRVATTKVGDQNIFVVSAPMLEENRISASGKPRNRANTTDGYLMTAKLFNVKPEDQLRALVVTDAVFTPFQHVDAEKVFAPFGVAVETAGFTRAHAGMDTDWPGGDSYYLQEILSNLRSTRDARDALVD